MASDYPPIISRYFASVIDVLVAFLIAFILGNYILNPEAEQTAKIIFFITPFLVYEPVFTAYITTVGQLIFGFRVRQFNSNKRLSLIRTFIRFMVKYNLGFISVLTIPAREDRRALHDLASNSIIKYASTKPSD